MKILFILEYYHPNVGGVEKLFKRLAEEMTKKGHEVLIITNRYNRTLKKEEVIEGVNIKRLRLYNRFFFTFFSFPQILRHGKKYDIIHTTSYNAALPAWFAAKILRKKIIITFHEVWGKLWFKLPFINYFQKTLFYLFEQFILKLPFDKYVAVSDSTKENLIIQGVNQKRVVRIYNGIDYPLMDADTNIPVPKKFIFTYLGRLGISKGLDLLIPAAKDFFARHPDSILKIISPNKPKGLYQKVKKLIRKNRLQNNLVLLHDLSQEDVKHELRSSHCIVIPSYSEGFCFVAAEAAAFKTPIISSARGALEEVVSGEYIVMNSLTPMALFDALVKAKNSNFDYIPHKFFLIEDCLSKYQKLYTSL